MLNINKVFIFRDRAKKNRKPEYLEQLDKIECWVKGFFKIVRSPKNADLIIVIGGDGSMVRATKKFKSFNIPFYGINRGTYGFLLNNHSFEDNLTTEIQEAKLIKFPLLKCFLHFENGQTKTVYAFNDIWTKTAVAQSAKHKILINEIEITPDIFSGDGIIISTAGGTTAYTCNAGGIILPHTSSNLELTPVCPQRPVGIKAEVLAGDTVFEIKLLENNKRKHLVCADGDAFKNVKQFTVKKSNTFVTLAFKKNNSYNLKLYKLKYPWLPIETLNKLEN